MKRVLHPGVYIMTTKSNHVHYTGVTSNLLKRVAEHKDKVVPGFTASYNVTEPVHFRSITAAFLHYLVCHTPRGWRP